MHQACGDLLQRLCFDTRDTPRVMLVVAHPNDETLAAGSRLPAWRHDLQIVYTTDGVTAASGADWPPGLSRDQYAYLRREELRAALTHAGITFEQVVQASTPAGDLQNQIKDTVLRLWELIAGFSPDAIVTLPFEGGDADHDATALAVHTAVALLAQRGLSNPPLLEAAMFHMRENELIANKFLPVDGYDAVGLVLPNEQRRLKQKMIACFATQRDDLNRFIPAVERFRAAPEYDFTRAPRDESAYDFDAWLAATRAGLHELAER